MYVVILAAGKGSRMKSSLPKVIHEVAGKPMIEYSVALAKELNPLGIFVVVGSDNMPIKKILGDGVEYVVQKEQKGTADAVLAVKDKLIGNPDKSVLILCGDMPNLNPQTVKEFLGHSEPGIPNFISVKLANPAGYGRVIRSIDRRVIRIVEDKDANDLEKRVSEVNTGIFYCNIKEIFTRLEKIDNQNSQKEYYLTDIALNGSNAWCAFDEQEFYGVNDRHQLSVISRIIWKRRAEKFMKEGVYIMDPDNTYISAEAQIANDVIIYPGVFIEGKTSIGSHSILYSGVRLVDTSVGSHSIIKDNSLLESSSVGDNCNIGPMAHLRPGSRLAGENKIGNFVELKKTSMGKGSNASHLSYLGDTTIGEKVNIGCGVITCNYDGYNKYETKVGNNVFVGSDSQIIAPVNVGDNAIIGAGSTITLDVPENALAISRVEQRNLEGRADIIRATKQKVKDK